MLKWFVPWRGVNHANLPGGFRPPPFLRPFLVGATHRALLVDHQHLAEVFTQVQPRPVQSAANRPHGKAQNLGDRLIAATIDLPQYEDHSVLLAQRGNRPLNLLNPLHLFEPFAGAVLVVDRLVAADFLRVLNRHRRPSPSPLAGGDIEGDPVEPSVKRAGMLERVQTHKRLYERLLRYIQGVFAVTDHVVQRVEQPVLVSLDQLPKRSRSARQGIPNQLGVVAHSTVTR